jgi:hypothetical protein
MLDEGSVEGHLALHVLEPEVPPAAHVLRVDREGEREVDRPPAFA